MNNFGITPCLAVLDAMFNRWNNMSPIRHNLVLALVVLVFLALGVAIWAMFVHAPNHPNKNRHNKKKNEPEKRHRKWRKRRREHRPLNPTLAETGGLPPARDPSDGPRPEAGP